MDRYVTTRIPQSYEYANIDRNEIEDEFHFVMKCSLRDIRQKLFTDINNILKSIYDELNENKKFLLIMGTGDHDVINPVAEFIHNAFEKHHNNCLACFINKDPQEVTQHAYMPP